MTAARLPPAGKGRRDEMKRVLALAVAVLMAGMAGAGAIDKTIPMPRRDQSVKIGFASEGGRIESVRIQHYPSADDIEKAKTKDLNDKQLTFWNFSVGNRSDKKVKIEISVEVIGKDGTVVGKGDKSDSVDAGKLDDNIRVWVRMKTLDIISARSARLHLSIGPK
jgi:hypothetical protein